MNKACLSHETQLHLSLIGGLIVGVKMGMVHVVVRSPTTQGFRVRSSVDVLPLRGCVASSVFAVWPHFGISLQQSWGVPVASSHPPSGTNRPTGSCLVFSFRICSCTPGVIARQHTQCIKTKFDGLTFPGFFSASAQPIAIALSLEETYTKDWRRRGTSPGRQY